MSFIDFSSTKWQSLRQGFEKGLSAPFMLFGNFQSPPLKKIENIKVKHVGVDKAITGDWLTIGEDFRNVIRENYDKERQKIPTP